MIQYAALPYNPTKYPLYLLQSEQWNDENPTVLVTGGVHGYETSGVHGALRFAEAFCQPYLSSFNFIIAPCLSPWGYETINRWNPYTVDPNRSFTENSPSDEAASLMKYIADNKLSFIAHIDLHETTDTDNTTFRPALAARDGIVKKNWSIPDGFYGVGDTENPVDDFQAAIIASVEKVTHIAPDDDGKLIGVPIAQRGVINYETKLLGLCSSLTGANYCSTTEVYPDSPKVDDENCILAQVAAITGGLDYLIALAADK